LDHTNGLQWFTVLISRVFNGSWIAPQWGTRPLEHKTSSWVSIIKTNWGLSKELRARYDEERTTYRNSGSIKLHDWRWWIAPPRPTILWLRF
jgi:hypothetical protein